MFFRTLFVTRLAPLRSLTWSIASDLSQKIRSNTIQTVFKIPHESSALVPKCAQHAHQARHQAVHGNKEQNSVSVLDAGLVVANLPPDCCNDNAEEYSLAKLSSHPHRVPNRLFPRATVQQLELGGERSHLRLTIFQTLEVFVEQSLLGEAALFCPFLSQEFVPVVLIEIDLFLDLFLSILISR